MITELKPQAFLAKIEEVAAVRSEPLRVEIVRQVAPEFVQVGAHAELRDFVHVVYRFQHEGEDYLAREFAPFDESGEADLGELALWPKMSRLIADSAPANDDTPLLPRNVRPVLMHRSGSV